MKCFSFSELIGLWSLLATIISLITAFFTSEFRKRLKLDKSEVSDSLKDAQKTNRIEVFAIVGIIFLFLTFVGLLFWFPLCWKAECKSPDSPPTPVQKPSPENPSEVEVYPPVEINGSEFRLYVFLKEYYWVYKTNDVKKVDKPQTEEEMVTALKGRHSDMKEEHALIAVGTASFDGGNKVEEDRAERRAELLTLWIRDVMGELKKGEVSPDLRRLNLGHYKSPPDKDGQRPILIIGVRRVKPDSPSIEDILDPKNQEILKQELKKKQFKFLFENYSKFELYKAS